MRAPLRCFAIVGVAPSSSLFQPSARRAFQRTSRTFHTSVSIAGKIDQAFVPAGVTNRSTGGAQISPKHANFIENADGARTADALALMAEARRRANEERGVELVHEVELLGEIEFRR